MPKPIKVKEKGKVKTKPTKKKTPPTWVDGALQNRLDKKKENKNLTKENDSLRRANDSLQKKIIELKLKLGMK